MNLDVNVIFNVVLFAGIIGAAAIYITSNARRENHQETRELADTRGEKIDDLEDDIRNMQKHMLKLDGQIELLLSSKFNELASGVAQQIVTELRVELHRLSFREDNT